MPGPLPLALHNPALLPAGTLLAEFTARRLLLETLLGIVRHNAPGQPPQHVLLLGARGLGKTTMLWAVAHRVHGDASLARAWQPVVFDEESRRVGDLADFWLEALRQWEHATRRPPQGAERLLEEAPPDDIESQARKTFFDAVERSGRRALLLIDNLNELLAAIGDAAALHRLRALLMEDARVMIVGTATRSFDAVTQLDQPFHDFFRTFELKPLSLEEMKRSLLTLAERSGDEPAQRVIEAREGTVCALHLLTGGNPRLVKTFYRLLAEGLRGDIRTDLERLLDDFTPYFKAIIDALPVQQQRIFDAVALAWDPVEVAVIAQATRLPSNQVSAQLRALVRAGLVTEAGGGPKRKTYLVADRFSNIHYLMRHGRVARARFDWFVRLVRLLYPDREQPELFARLARQCAENGPEGQTDARDLLHSALARAETNESRRRIVDATLRASWDGDTLESLAQWLDVAEARTHFAETDVVAFFGAMPSELRQRLGYRPDDSRWWYQLTEHLENEEAWELADRAYQTAIALDPKNGSAWRERAKLLKNRFGRLTEAESGYRRALEIDPSDAHACNGFADLHECCGRFTEAEATYHKAIALNPKFAAPWNNLGNLLQDHFTRYGEAQAAYRRAIELDPNYSLAWNNLGNLQADHLGQRAAAEASFRKAIECDPNHPYPWAGLARLLAKMKKTRAEARAAAVRALLLGPHVGYVIHVFWKICGRSPEDWHVVLPPLAKRSLEKPGRGKLFELVACGLLELARLEKPASVAAFIERLEGAARFEILRDVVLAAADREHLNRLAPERRAIAIELLRRTCVAR